MLPNILLHPELRCQAHSRRSGWLQCGRLAAFGSTVCTTHGARKKPRFGADAPNFKHGERTLQNIVETRHANQRLKLLAKGVEEILGDEKAGAEFKRLWPNLIRIHGEEIEELQERIQGKRRR